MSTELSTHPPPPPDPVEVPSPYRAYRVTPPPRSEILDKYGSDADGGTIASRLRSLEKDV
ncbi:hypothetical protein BX616_004084, partial [Lobosporangium transversale]